MARRKVKVPDNYLITPDVMSNMVVKNTPKWQKSWQQKRPYASQVGLCARLSTLSHLTPEHWVEKGPTLNFYADIGNAFEDRFNLNIFRRAGIFIQTGWKMPQVLFENKFDIGGKVDSLLWLDEEKTDLVMLEVKTVANVERIPKVKLTAQEMDGFANGQEIILSPNNENDSSRIKETAPMNPKASHIAQAEIYSAITGIDTTFVLLVSRGIVDVWDFNKENNISHKFFCVDISAENLAKRVASCIYACKCNEAGYVAQKPKAIKRSHCKSVFCSFEQTCWGDEKFGCDDELFTHIPAVLSNEWKKEAYASALEYVDNRPERYAKTLELMHEYEKGNIK